MANSIALAEKYAPLLDLVYKKESKTAILDTPEMAIHYQGANKIEVLKSVLEGLGNYDRNSGFPAGSITATWEAFALTQDRGKSFMLDTMDDDETLGILAGNVMSQFAKEYVIPEVDAYRFATYATAAKTKLQKASITDAIAEIDTAEVVLGDDEVPDEGRILYVGEAFYKLIKSGITRTLANEGEVSRIVEYFDGMQVVRVPKGRFNTQVTISATNGYTATGNDIHFMIVHPSAVFQVAKHEKVRTFTPDVNQSADAWKFDYRLYHDAFVYGNKTAGIYVCSK